MLSSRGCACRNVGLAVNTERPARQGRENASKSHKAGFLQRETLCTLSPCSPCRRVRQVVIVDGRTRGKVKRHGVGDGGDVARNMSAAMQSLAEQPSASPSSTSFARTMLVSCCPFTRIRRYTSLAAHRLTRKLWSESLSAAACWKQKVVGWPQRRL